MGTARSVWDLHVHDIIINKFVSIMKNNRSVNERRKGDMEEVANLFRLMQSFFTEILSLNLATMCRTC